jgi:hypothetical protein
MHDQINDWMAMNQPLCFDRQEIPAQLIALRQHRCGFRGELEALRSELRGARALKLRITTNLEPHLFVLSFINLPSRRSRLILDLSVREAIFVAVLDQRRHEIHCSEH